MAFFRRRRDRPGATPAPPTSGRGEAPGSPARPDAERRLRAVLERLAAPGPDPGNAGRAAVSDAAVDAAVDELLASGRARTAAGLLQRIVALLPAGPEAHRVAARLVELLCDRMEYAEAVPHLEALLAAPAHAARARFLLAEAAERSGDRDGARRHYEILLAEDIDHPKARERFERLRPQRAAAAATPTVAGVAGEQVRVGARYRLRRELGRGASGAVYLALDEALGREVALKLLHPHASARVAAEARLRAWNEARIAAALRHPGVVAVYDLDEERGLIAMEWCAGGTLRERLARGPAAAAGALGRAAELYATLEAVHRAGVIHRDLKPGNLLFREPPPLAGEEERLVLGDFGLAAFQHGAEGEAGAGTLAYLAPEARRGEAGPAADVYAGGVILCEMLAGALPFDHAALLRGDTRWGQVLPEAIRARLAPSQAAAVVALLGRLLDEDPAARPPPGEVSAALAALAA